MTNNTQKRMLGSMMENEAVNGEPVDVVDQINKYGTYEVQDTTDTDNVFPTIGPLGAGATGVLLPDIPDAVRDKQRPHKD